LRAVGEVVKKLTKSNKIENIQRRIKRYIDSLVNLRLMKETGQVKEEKGSGLIPTYSYTPSGYFISQIIQCIIHGKENAGEQLYTLFRDRFFKAEDDSLSFIIFNSKFIETIHEKNLFGDYVSTFQKALDSKEITDIESFARVIQNYISPVFQQRLFVGVWQETLGKLDPQTRQLYMYEQKLAIDVKMGSKALSKDYEVLRLKLRENVEEVALEGICIACHEHSAFYMKIIEYTKSLVNADKSLLFANCPKCDAYGRTLQVPILWQ
jgi:hypothetical protein